VSNRKEFCARRPGEDGLSAKSFPKSPTLRSAQSFVSVLFSGGS
jgi:hypothetical protein